jgi:SsrA-binding protein
MVNLPKDKYMPVLADNKKAYYNYQVLEEFEAGLVLSGPEVKAAKLGHINLKGSFVSIGPEGAVIKNMHISPYLKAKIAQINYTPAKTRQLLLNKQEIDHLIGKNQEKGLTIVPLSVYTTRRLVKVKIALVKGKKEFDKRQTIKQRDTNREIARKLKNRF